MNDPLRTLARSHEYQNLYARAKELNINLFNNVTDFSLLQLRFLQYLELYHNLYNRDSEEKLLDDERIKDDMLVDAYLTYKYKNKDKKDKKNKNTKKFKGTTQMPQIVFKKRRKV